MGDRKFRIPRLAVAALVLGGACGDDEDKEGGSGASSALGTNVSQARMNKLSAMYCDLYAKCDPEYFAMYYDSKADCVRAYVGDFHDYVETYGKVCTDAVFDMVECEFTPECSTFFNDDEPPNPKCDALGKKVAEVCPEGFFDEDDYSYSSSTRNPVSSKRRSLRIPRQ